MTVMDWSVPAPRPDVVDMFAMALETRESDTRAAALCDTRMSWATGAEIAAGYHLAIEMLKSQRGELVDRRDVLDRILAAHGAAEGDEVDNLERLFQLPAVDDPHDGLDS